MIDTMKKSYKNPADLGLIELLDPPKPKPPKMMESSNEDLLSQNESDINRPGSNLQKKKKKEESEEKPLDPSTDPQTDKFMEAARSTIVDSILKEKERKVRKANQDIK